MQTNITDKDRLNTLNALFIQEGKTAENGLPFSRNKLDYLRPLMVRLKQIPSKNRLENLNDHSAIMLRQMIDELLLEITAQVSWSVGPKKNGNRKKVLSDFGLLIWNQMANPILITSSKVAC
jgi:hypothetical protein